MNFAIVPHNRSYLPADLSFRHNVRTRLSTMICLGSARQSATWLASSEASPRIPGSQSVLNNIAPPLQHRRPRMTTDVCAQQEPQEPIQDSRQQQAYPTPMQRSFSL